MGLALSLWPRRQLFCPPTIMVLDLLSNASTYHGLHPLFPQAFAYLESFDEKTPDGKVELVGTDLVAMVQRYATADTGEKEWEAHEVYGDIQVVIRGQERCGYTARGDLRVSKPYNPEKDVEKFLAPEGECTSLLLKPRLFAIFYPQDAHQPGVKVAESGQVLKVVMKFRLRV